MTHKGHSSFLPREKVAPQPSPQISNRSKMNQKTRRSKCRLKCTPQIHTRPPPTHTRGHAAWSTPASNDCQSLRFLCIHDPFNFWAYHTPNKKLRYFMEAFRRGFDVCRKLFEKKGLNFEIHIFFANAFESTLPLPKVQDLSQLPRSRDLLLFHWPLAPVPASVTSQNVLYKLRISMFILKSK